MARLATEFHRPLHELLDSMPSWEITFWRAFELVEGPLGYKREDWRAARLTAATLNAGLKPKRPFSEDDSLLKTTFSVANEVEVNRTPTTSEVEARRNELKRTLQRAMPP